MRGYHTAGLTQTASTPQPTWDYVAGGGPRQYGARALTNAWVLGFWNFRWMTIA